MVLCVGVADQSQNGSVYARARFHHMWDEPLLGLVVKIFQRLTAPLLMLQQIVVGSVRDTLELLAAKREIIFDVVSAL